MKIFWIFIAISALTSSAFGAGHPDHWSDVKSNSNTPQTTVNSWTFDNTKTGKLPHGWKIEGTNQQGPIASWMVKADSSRPGSSKVLVLNNAHQGSGGTFNLCWTDRVKFTDGTIEVKLKADSGSIDQGGGIMWRVQDKDNYYITRWNPLEDNFRFYRVVNGQRHQLASAAAKGDPEQWHSLRIEHAGGLIKCFFDNELLLNFHDTTFNKAGGTGVWTKADAETRFDNFEVKGWVMFDSHNEDAR